VEEAAPLSDAASDPLRRCEDLLAEAVTRFRAGEFQSAADAALSAGEQAKLACRPDLLAAAALTAVGIPDAATAPAFERLCREALSLGDPSQAALQARLHAQLAVALHHRGRLDEADTEVSRAVALSSTAGDPRALAAVFNARQLTLAGLGHGEELYELGGGMLELAEELGSVDVELQARNWRIDALFRLGDTAGAGYEIDTLDVLGGRSGLVLVRWNARLAQAGLAQAVGRLTDAERLAREARNIMPPEQRAQTEQLFIAQLMLISTDRGSEPPEIDVARGFTVGGHAIAAAMIGRYDLEMGDLTRARASFEAIRPRLGDIPMDRRGLATLTAGAELAVAFGEARVASDLHRRLAPFDGAMIASAIGAVGPVAYFLARIEGLLGLHDQALAHARAAIELSARGDFGPWLARSRLAVAETLVLRGSRGDREEARKAAGMAAVTARTLAMRALLGRALTLVDHLADQPLLTNRQREIASLVATGSSNRAIAESLNLSERTVETHVQSLLNKLGFHSRAQIAAWSVAQAGSLERPIGGVRDT
jgi:DNA-binding CsgD family transcriptional regulator